MSQESSRLSTKRDVMTPAGRLRLWLRRRRARIVLITLVLVVGVVLLAALYALQDPFLAAALRFGSGTYLAPLVELRRQEDHYLASPQRDIFLQAIATYSSYVGNYQDALGYYDRVSWISPTPIELRSSAFDECEPRDAISVLAEIADSYQVIFINEAHHVPQHRAFTLTLLKVLRDKGFRYFAAEALSESGEQLNQRGYPLIVWMGSYTNEPIYGDLVRTALKLDYEVVPYEHLAFDQNSRERGQAQNLVDRILQRDASAKIIVHAGYGHIDEVGGGGWTPMAKYFKEITGIDPFTIDQTTMTEQSSPEYEDADYRYAIDRGLITEPTIFQCKEDFWVQEYPHDGRYDIQLFHPRSQYEYGRPTWLQLGGTRMPYQLSEGICHETFPCLVQAVAVDEDPMAVPIDQIEIRSASELPALMLPEGEFIVRVRDTTGKTISEFRISVKGK